MKIAVAATAGVLLAACGTGAPSTQTPSTQTPSTRTSSTATSPGPSAPLTANPTTSTPSSGASPAVVRRAAGTYTRAQIPWGQVGSAWTGVVLVPIATSTKTDPGATAGTLYLVSPEGARYAIGNTAPGDDITDVTPDGRRILITRYDSRTHVAVTQVWDAQTGVARTVATGMEYGHFSRPQGTAVIGKVVGADGAAHLQRYGLDGRLQLTYSMSGVPVFVVRPPDGQSLVVETTTGVTVLSNVTGTPLRTIPTPSGTSSCRPVSMWTSTQLLVSCDGTESGGSSSDLYTVPVAGGPITRMPQAEVQYADGRSGFGFVGAWPSSVGVILQRGTGCGNGGYALVRTDGRVTALTFPEKSTSVGGPVVLGIVGATALLSVSNGGSTCGGGQFVSLVAHDLVTGASRPLAGPMAGTGALSGQPVVLGAAA